ncbi:hypothetical protein KBG31_00860 [Patescibacteria group bacterium]|nr:hypothetical protein [Patescibacteria group bacterium]
MIYVRKKSLEKAAKKKPRRFYLAFKKVKKALLTGFLVSLLLYGVYYALFRSPFFIVKSLEIKGASTFVNSVDLWNYVKPKTLDQRIFLIDTKTLSKEVSEIFLGAKFIEVQKRYPSGIIVFVEERVPLALLKSDTLPEYFLVDEEGYLLGIVDPDYKNLPIINYVGELRIGEFVNRELVSTYFDLIASLAETKIKSSSMSFHKDYVSFYTKEGILVLIDNEKDKFFALSTLSQLLKSLDFEDKNPKSIDLRYDKVVVSY